MTIMSIETDIAMKCFNDADCAPLDTNEDLLMTNYDYLTIETVIAMKCSFITERDMFIQKKSGFCSKDIECPKFNS